MLWTTLFPKSPAFGVTRYFPPAAMILVLYPISLYVIHVALSEEIGNNLRFPFCIGCESMASGLLIREKQCIKMMMMWITIITLSINNEEQLCSCRNSTAFSLFSFFIHSWMLYNLYNVSHIALLPHVT